MSNHSGTGEKEKHHRWQKPWIQLRSRCLTGLHQREKTSLILLEAWLITSSIFAPYRLAFRAHSLLIYICRLKARSDGAEVMKLLAKCLNSHHAVASSCMGLFKGLDSEGNSQMRGGLKNEKTLVAAWWEREMMTDPSGASSVSAPVRAAS